MSYMLGEIGAGEIGVLLGFLVAAGLTLACFAFWLWMLIHAVTNKGLRDTEKIVWVILIIFLPFLGSLIYFFVARPKAGR
jgi:hypothetical protein